VQPTVAEPRADLEREEPPELLDTCLEFACAKGTLNLGVLRVKDLTPNRLLQQVRKIESAEHPVEKCALRVASAGTETRELLDGLRGKNAERGFIVGLERREQLLEELRRRSGCCRRRRLGSGR
jgi:hypothetical protein